MTTSTAEKADGLKALENAIEKIRETIKKLGGVFNVNMAVNIYFYPFPTKKLHKLNLYFRLKKKKL